VLSRTIWGARTALEVMVLAVVFALFIGVPLGLISGYVGGWLDRILVLIMDALFAFPYLLLAIVASFLLKETIGNGIIVAAIAINRRLCAAVLPRGESVDPVGARIHLHRGGARHGREASHDHPQVPVRQRRPERAVIGTLNAADAILTLGRLGFLGLGIQPTEAAEWGYDLQRAIADAGAGIWWTALYPGLAIVLAVTLADAGREGLNDILTQNAAAAARPRAGDHVGLVGRRAGVGGHGRGGCRRMSEPVLSVRNLRIWYAPIAAPCAPSTASISTSTPARPSGWSASRAAASRRSAAAWSACCPRAPRARRGQLRRAQTCWTSRRASCASCAVRTWG